MAGEKKSISKSLAALKKQVTDCNLNRLPPFLVLYQGLTPYIVVVVTNNNNNICIAPPYNIYTHPSYVHSALFVRLIYGEPRKIGYLVTSLILLGILETNRLRLSYF